MNRGYFAVVVAIAGILGVAASIGSCRHSDDPVAGHAQLASTREPLVVSQPSTSSEDQQASIARRKVYRHSVIPGGVYSARELAVALDGDRVAKAHYKTVDLKSIRMTKLAMPRRAYVSYRIGGRIYWTKNKVTLASGESILSDGKVEIRARCGNCISSEPRTPTAVNEPPPPELNETIDPPAGGITPPEASAMLFPAGPPFLAEPPSYPNTDPVPNGLPVPFVPFPIPWSGGGSSRPPSPPTSIAPPSESGGDLLPDLPPLLPPAGGGNGDENDDGGHGDDVQNVGGDQTGSPGDIIDAGGGNPPDSSPGPTPVTVPEPSTIMLAAFGAMTELLRRRLRRRPRA